MSLKGKLRAMVDYVTPGRDATNKTGYNIMCLNVGTLPFYINAWDIARAITPHLQQGDYIECEVEACPWMEEKEQGDIYFAYKCNKPINLINEPEDMGLNLQMSGVVTSLDVHIGCGRGNQVIAVDTELKVPIKKQFGGHYLKKLYRVHLIVRQSDMDVLKLKKGDRIWFDGLVDPSIQERITFTKVFTVQWMGELTNV